MKVKLKELCVIQSGGTPNRSNKQYWDNGTINWAKISDIKDKYLFNTEEKITEEGLKNSSAKLFKKNSILYTIFATLGEACILGIDTTTNQAIANLEIRDKNVETEYIYYYLLSKKKLISGIGRGVAQNNINLSILKEMEINLADITTQKRIVDILNQNESIINKYKKQIALLDTLIKARFVEMFGDPVNNSKHLEVKTLSELGEFGRGVSKHRPRNDPKLLDGKYPLIQTGDIASADLYIENYNSTYSEIGLKQSKMWKKGTLCITIAANIANTAILDFDACFPDSIVGFNSNGQINNIFMHYWFSFFQSIIDKQAPAVAQKNINLVILSKLKVIAPPLELQEQFAAFVKEVDKLKFDVQKSLEKTQMLFDSLMQEYFE